MQNSNESKGKIVSLQALRAIAFIGIFLGHAGSSIHWSALGVSIFLVMSGFLMEYTYSNRDISTSVKENIKFSLKKIKKLYPLHILTMICAVILIVIIAIYTNSFTKRLVISTLGKILLNVTLLQTWIPNSNINTSLNGVAWYLSVTMFLYFVYPYIRKWIKNKSKKFLGSSCMLILIFEILSCIPWIYFLGNNNLAYIWFMYCFPIFRLGEFFIGCCMGKFYIQNENKITSNKSLFEGTIVEFMVLLLTILVIKSNTSTHTTIFIKAIYNWTTIYIPLAVMWIYIFIANCGLLTKVLNNRFFVFIGDISSYTFLIHYVITQYTNKICDLLNLNLTIYMKIGLIIIEFCITILISIGYTKMVEHIKNKKSLN